jgi:hypothetical protein
MSYIIPIWYVLWYLYIILCWEIALIYCCLGLNFSAFGWKYGVLGCFYIFFKDVFLGLFCDGLGLFYVVWSLGQNGSEFNILWKVVWKVWKSVYIILFLNLLWFYRNFIAVDDDWGWFGISSILYCCYYCDSNKIRKIYIVSSRYN